MTGRQAASVGQPFVRGEVPLADDSGLVACGAERTGQCWGGWIQAVGGVVGKGVVGQAVVLAELAGHHTGSSWHTDGIVRDAIMKHHSGSGNFFQMGGLDLRGSAQRPFMRALLVAENDDDVRFSLARCGRFGHTVHRQGRQAVLDKVSTFHNSICCL